MIERKPRPIPPKKPTPAAVRTALRRQGERNGYEITVEDRDRLLDEQGHCCAVCKRPFRPPPWHLDCAFDGKVVGRRVGTSPAVDHNHGNGRVRGLLCRFCNRQVVPMVERHREAVETALVYVDNDGILNG